jgi:molecular chaperone GrpE (heat shock protein)
VSIAKKASSFGAKVVHIGSNSNSELKDIACLMVRIPVHTKYDLEDEIASMDEDEQTQTIQNDEISKLKDLLARTQADYNNFKQRSERDRQDMIFFLKQDIFKKILPRIDDLERIIDILSAGKVDQE